VSRTFAKLINNNSSSNDSSSQNASPHPPPRLLEWCNDALVQVQMETLADPHIGFAMLPKRTVNVKACELLRFARITPDFIHTVSVSASRARLDLFQDDLFPPCLSGQPCASMQEYASGGGLPELPRVSLRPEGMQVGGGGGGMWRVCNAG